jgi:luciferase family oxidoreductase group 1
MTPSSPTPLRLSILDQSPVGQGATPADALAASVALARQADRLGFLRYWVAEHHDSSGFAGTAPEVLVATLLARTARLRIGSGGVLLPRYDPAKVAEVFQVLSALHPGRVDLGVGRAGGPAHRYPEQVADLANRLAARSPDGGREPSLWLLGSSGSSATLAATVGASYSFAHFFNPDLGVAALETFRTHSAGLPAEDPRTRSSLAVRVLVAETAAQAAELALAFLLWRSRKDLGIDEPFPSPDTARTHRWSTAEERRAAADSQTIVTGAPEQVQAELTSLAAEHDVDELIINTPTHDPADRLTAYRLLVELFLTTTATSLRKRRIALPLGQPRAFRVGACQSSKCA